MRAGLRGGPTGQSGAGELTASRQAALLAAVCLILHHLGPLPAAVEAPAIAVALLVRAATTGIRRAQRGWLAPAAVMLRWGPALVGIPLLLAARDPETRLCILIVLIAAACDRHWLREAVFVAVVLATTLAARLAPFLWLTGVELSRLGSELAGRLTAQRLDLGPSVSGLYLLALAILLRLCARADHGRDALRPARFLAAGVLWVGFMAALPWLGRQGGPLDLRGLFNLTHEHLAPTPQQVVPSMLGWLAVLCIVLCLVLLNGAPDRHLRPAPGWRARGAATAVALSLCAAAALVSAAEAIPASARAGEIIMLRGPGADAATPVPGRWGLASAGMFGMLPRSMEIEGLHLRSEEGELTEEMLEGAAALVMVLPAAGLDDVQVARAHRFVERGGSLVVLADHTDLMGIMEPANRLLAPAGIRVLFDSAFPAVPFWHRCLSGPLAAGNGPTGLGTGASLAIRGPARPLLVARYGLSDRGDRANAGPGAFLGNYAYDAGERIGDLPVAAWARVGKGRIVAFGDTSSFQNLPLPFSHRFVHALLAPMALPASPARQAPGGRPAGRQVAIVDMSHLNDIAADFWRKDSIGGLLATLQRTDRIPIVARSTASLRQLLDRHPRALWVLVAPRRRLPASLAATLRDRLRRGADLLVAAGPESSRAVGPLLREHGMWIEQLPLGPVPVLGHVLAVDEPHARPADGSGPQFKRAWAVGMTRPGSVRIWYEAFGRPVVADVMAEGEEAGRLMLIADPSFLTDDVLEDEHGARAGNVKLLTHLLAGTWQAPGGR